MLWHSTEIPGEPLRSVDAGVEYTILNVLHGKQNRLIFAS